MITSSPSLVWFFRSWLSSNIQGTPTLTHLSGDVLLTSFCPEGFVGIGVPIGTDVLYIISSSGLPRPPDSKIWTLTFCSIIDSFCNSNTLIAKFLTRSWKRVLSNTQMVGTRLVSPSRTWLSTCRMSNKEWYQAFLGVLIDLIMLHYWVLGLDYQSIW
jgi:hypothetical protein